MTFFFIIFLTIFLVIIFLYFSIYFFLVFFLHLFSSYFFFIICFILFCFCLFLLSLLWPFLFICILLPFFHLPSLFFRPSSSFPLVFLLVYSSSSFHPILLFYYGIFFILSSTHSSIFYMYSHPLFQPFSFLSYFPPFRPSSLIFPSFSLLFYCCIFFFRPSIFNVFSCRPSIFPSSLSVFLPFLSSPLLSSLFLPSFSSYSFLWHYFELFRIPLSFIHFPISFPPSFPSFPLVSSFILPLPSLSCGIILSSSAYLYLSSIFPASFPPSLWPFFPLVFFPFFHFPAQRRERVLPATAQRPLVVYF